MPLDLEMLLASSHSFFPYTSLNSSNYHNSYDRSLSFSRNHCVPRSPFRDQFHKKPEHRGFDSRSSYNLKDNVIFGQELCGVRKKKVSFADDKGFQLVEVREIPDAPKWADDVITLLIGNTKRSVVKEKKWKAAFDNPPWTSENLTDTVEKNMIALENISVKEGSDDFLVGTVKVKNLAYEKNVFLRVTFDRWLSYIDVPCSYIKPYKESTRPNIYDTFHFSTKILPVASRYEVIEFCICYQCDKKEYWDNNKGINYRLVVEYVKNSTPDSHYFPVSAVWNKEKKDKEEKFYSDTVDNTEKLLMSYYPYY